MVVWGFPAEIIKVFRGAAARASDVGLRLNLPKFAPNVPRKMKNSYRAMVGGRLRVGQAVFLVYLVLAGLVAGCRRSANDLSGVAVHPSVLVPFDELFALEDSLVLDPSIILGRIWFMEADTSGSVLVTDIASNLAHLFAPTGRHEATYSMDTCLPSGDEHSVWMSRFADGDRVILSTTNGSMVVFDRSGDCLAATQGLISPIRSFCAHGDSIFVFRGPRGMNRPTTSVVGVYSVDLELKQEILLEPPEFTMLNLNFMGIAGRDMDCFSDGPWYKYHEDMDARPVNGYSLAARSRPDFFVRRNEDVPSSGQMSKRQESLNAFPLLSGVYALDDGIRMTRFTRIDDAFRPSGVTGRSVTGLSIVSNTGKFRSVSTVPHKPPKTARYGYLYFLGDHVPMDDGDVGNPTVIRYRFKPPEAADD